MTDVTGRYGIAGGYGENGWTLDNIRKLFHKNKKPDDISYYL